MFDLFHISIRIRNNTYVNKVDTSKRYRRVVQGGSYLYFFGPYLYFFAWADRICTSLGRSYLYFFGLIVMYIYFFGRIVSLHLWVVRICTFLGGSYLYFFGRVVFVLLISKGMAGFACKL
jgi:hypothetical protein